jgi:ubiquinone/menaquinone biosynthesis C-methylase UbiE
LERIKLDSDSTVLDVGCGAGLLAIPMAKKCKCVTALDASSEMLKYLAQNASCEGVTNITPIHKQFENVTIGKDLGKHDIVIASRSMGLEHDLRKFLKNMDEAAKKRAYAIWSVGKRTFDIGLYKAIDRPYGETRTYTVIYNLLHQMGVFANIEIFECQPMSMSYNSIADALSILSHRFERMGKNKELNKKEKTRLKKYLEETLTKTSEGTLTFVDKHTAHQALMWWEKKQIVN